MSKDTREDTPSGGSRPPSEAPHFFRNSDQKNAQHEPESGSTKLTLDFAEIFFREKPYPSEIWPQIPFSIGRKTPNPAFSRLTYDLTTQSLKQEQTQPSAADETAGSPGGKKSRPRRCSRSSHSRRSNGQMRTTVDGNHSISAHVRWALINASTMWFGHKLNASLTVRGPDRKTLNRKLSRLQRLLKGNWADAKYIAVLEKSPRLHAHVLLFVPEEALSVLRKMVANEEVGELDLRFCKTDADRLLAMDYATKVSEPFPYRFSDFGGRTCMGNRAHHNLRRCAIGVQRKGKETQETFEGPRISLFGFGTRNILEALSPSRQARRRSK